MNFRLTNISSLQLFQLIRYTSYILIGVVFTKTSLSTHEIGEYEQFLFLSGAVSFFWLNGLVRGLLPLAKEKTRTQGQAFFSAFLLISLFTLLAVFVLLLINGSGGENISDNNQIPYLLILLAYLFFSVPASLIEYFFMVRDESKKIVRYGLVNFSGMFLLVALPAVLGMPILFSLYGLLLSALIRYLYLVWLMIRHTSLKASISFIKEHLFLSFPLIISALLSGSAQYVDGFIVTSRYDESAFAVFRFGARELPLVLLLANAFSYAMLPEFAKKEQLEIILKKIKDESLRMSHYLFPMSAVLLLVSHYLFPLIFNADFKDSATIFNIYILLIISRLLFPQTILIGMKKTRMIAYASFVELLLNVGLSLWFVTLWGVSGIAYATVLAYLFEKLILIYGVKTYLNIPLIKYQNLSIHLGYSVFLLFVYYIVEFLIF